MTAPSPPRAWCCIRTTELLCEARQWWRRCNGSGIIPSFSRPHVSNDNPYSEALFRTLKHTPAYPRLPFADVDTARSWVARFADWYNGEHRHSAIRYATPDQRHFGDERVVLEQRHGVYERARRRRPQRWSRSTRNWTPVGTVLLNPEPLTIALAA
jgi:putative transposase